MNGFPGYNNFRQKQLVFEVWPVNRPCSTVRLKAAKMRSQNAICLWLRVAALAHTTAVV